MTDRSSSKSTRLGSTTSGSKRATYSRYEPDMTEKRWRLITRNRMTARASRQRCMLPQAVGFKVLSTLKDHTGSILIPDQDQGDTSAEPNFSACDIPDDIYEELMRRKECGLLIPSWGSVELRERSTPSAVDQLESESKAEEEEEVKQSLFNQEPRVRGMETLRHAVYTNHNGVHAESAYSTYTNAAIEATAPTEVVSSPESYAYPDFEQANVESANVESSSYGYSETYVAQEQYPINHHFYPIPQEVVPIPAGSAAVPPHMSSIQPTNWWGDVQSMKPHFSTMQSWDPSV